VSSALQEEATKRRMTHLIPNSNKNNSDGGGTASFLFAACSMSNDQLIRQHTGRNAQHMRLLWNFLCDTGCASNRQHAETHLLEGKVGKTTLVEADRVSPST
jgi:hypothetical protein